MSNLGVIGGRDPELTIRHQVKGVISSE